MAGSDSEPPDLEDGDFDMFDLFDLDLGDGKKTTINDPDAKKYLAQQRRAAQAEYEDTLIREVNKLQQLAKQDVVARRQAEAEILALKAREVKRRKDDQDRQRKQLAKLATAEALEKQQAADWAKKSREVEARTVEIERKKVEEQERSTEERIRAVRVLREKQEAITAKALHDRERQAAIKRQLDEQKRAALVSRLKTRSQQRLEANQRKATFAAERVHKAWESRNVALVEAREASELKHLRQEVRLYKLVEGKEAKQSSTKAKAGQKRLYIEKCVSQQLDRDEGVKARIDAKHSEREAAQDSAEAQRLKQIEVRQYERLAQQHEVRERVLSAIKSRQAHLGEVESKWAVKNGRTSALLKEREDASASRRQLYSLLTKERQSVINSMQLSKVNKKFILPPHVRKGISDATLKAVLDKADPKRTGAISLKAPYLWRPHARKCHLAGEPSQRYDIK
ncbi:hypothetical protein T492DRAFT_839579 [Pavlovales sp. CCMP2436]|nr:hypothetical protein T492DRAFT_839579 [Pavlovales sp. CCMP2436]